MYGMVSTRAGKAGLRGEINYYKPRTVKGVGYPRKSMRSESLGQSAVGTHLCPLAAPGSLKDGEE